MHAVIDNELDELKNDSGVLDSYLSRTRFKKNGREYEANCPFHNDKTPSCKLNQKDGRWLWFCHGCQRGGSILDFILEFDHVLEAEGIEILKRELGWNGEPRMDRAPLPDAYETQKRFVTVPLADYSIAEALLASNQTAKDWLLRERGISYEAAQRLHIGYRQKLNTTDESLQDVIAGGWLIFPSIDGVVVSLKYRSIQRKAFSRKYGMASALFNSETIDIFDDVYVCAGEFDALVLEQAGFHAVSVGSDSTPITPAMVSKLELAGRLILAGDSDDSGVLAMDKMQEKLPEALRLRWPEGIKDANQLWMQYKDDPVAFKQVVTRLTTELATPLVTDIISDTVTVIDPGKFDAIPVCSADIIDGDLIGDLTRILTNQTWIPPIFVRETIKTIMGAMIDGEVGFPAHEDLHLRQFNLNISPRGRTGKGESWKRAGKNPTGALASLITERNVQVLDGSGFGSGQYMIKKLAVCAADAQKGNASIRADVLARFDEMRILFEKASATGSTLESMLLQLYECDAGSQGSFKNGEFDFANLHLSLSGDFIKDHFERTFAGRGSGSSGFLARCVFAYSKPEPHTGDWAATDLIARTDVVSKIRECMKALPSNPPDDDQLLFGDNEPWTAHRFIPPETHGAKQMRLAFLLELNKEDDRYVPEIEAHLKRDILMRTVFSDNQVIDEAKTGKAIMWARYQLQCRRLLWPEDEGNPVEMMEHRIHQSLSAKNLSSTDLLKYCHVDRPGSGGREVFNRAVKSLLVNDIHIAGKTRKGFLIYSLNGKFE